MAERSLSGALASAALWLGLILVGTIALWGTRPPPAAEASALPDVFSAPRAMIHLAQIARHPHPIGSDEAEHVREYLVEQLRSLGAEVHVEQAVGTASYGRTLNAGLVNNIVATFPGRANSRAIMLVAHSDSVAEGPGAGDDGAGLIVILETIRALRAGAPIKNDVIVLFSDGEEAHGLLGAQAFAAGHRDFAEQIGMMVNLEARGSSGPGLMFETSDDNGALIREFARAAPYPRATSLMAAVYKLLPNDTDFTPLKAAGATGLNFAFIQTYQSYHTRLDTIGNLDVRTVQHLGDNVLGITRHFGNLTLPLSKERDLVYFNWFGNQLLTYPVWLAWVIALLAPIVFVFACVRSKRRFGLTVGRTTAGFGIFFLQLLIIVGGSIGAFIAAKFIAGEFLEGDTLSNQLLFAGVMVVAFGLTISCQRLLRNKIGLANLAVGQLLAVSLLNLAVCWFLVGGSYALQWPLVFAMAGLLPGLRATEPVRPLFQFLFLIPALLILVPLAYMFFVALTFTHAALAAAGFLLANLIAMAAPLVDRLAGRLKLSLVFVFLVSALLIGAGIRLSARSAAHPRRDTLIYSINADENKAKWISYDDAADNWTSRILGPALRKQSEPYYTAGLERPVLGSDATVVSLSAPFVAMTQNTVLDAEQTIRLQITSTRGARSIVVRLPHDLKPTVAGWNGDVQRLHDDDSQAKFPWTFRFFNASSDGVTLEFRFPARNGIKVWIADSTPGLPAVAPFSPRPDNTTPGYGSDITLVAKALEL
jgi:hypothetical protein